MTGTNQQRLPMLDARLRCVEALVPSCDIAADIGCDHGKLGLHLLYSGKCQQVVFGDISEPSLNKARNLLAFHRLNEQAVFVESDGLEAIEHALDAVVICGLGGEGIATIIRRGVSKLQNAEMILSPQTEASLVRRELWHCGFELKREMVVRSRGRYYTVIQATRTLQPKDYTERELFIGVHLQAYEDTTLDEYLRWRFQVMQRDRRADPAHLAWLREEMDLLASNGTDNL